MPPLPRLLCLLVAFPLFLYSSSYGAALHIDQSDLKAFDSFVKSLGIRSYQDPCSYPGVICEKSTKTNTLQIKRIVFHSRGLHGVLSPAIGRFSELRELSLPKNRIVGRVPPSLMNCSKLEVLDLGNNHLSGNVPVELQSLVRLRVVDLSCNKLAGNLHFLESLPNLERVSLANNLFSGTIPQSVKKLRYFDLSGNGILEESLHSYYPNRYILGENSSVAGAASDDNNDTSDTDSAEAPSASPANQGRTKKKNRLRNWILGFGIGGFAGIVCGFIFSFVCKLIVAAVRGARKDPGPDIFTSLIKPEHLAFLRKDDGLESLEIIGSGGCGQVYRSSLPGLADKMIAIKKISQPMMDPRDLTEEDSKMLSKKMRQIRAEINTVSRIRHKNLLPLLAHVARSDCHYLVYEYMKNGSLLDVLKSVSDGTRELNWLARHKIALGIAEGLEYLHSSHKERIIHRDLKPANILLDDNMEARIADFGLAKPMSDANTHVTTSNIAGTVGYIAPEYHQSLKFTDKCDIYSFGVVLGALVMGKQPSDEFFQDTREMSMVKWMHNIMASDNPTRAIDSSLLCDGYDEQILLVLKIACFCTMEDPKQRPNSKQVRLMLAQIKH